MANFNKVLLMGNLTRDQQLKYLPTTNTAVAEFGIAVNRKWKAPTGEDREEVCFVDCSAFGKTGELINQYFQKGKPIFVEGRLKLDQWEDKQGGGKRSIGCKWRKAGKMAPAAVQLVKACHEVADAAPRPARVRR